MENSEKSQNRAGGGLGVWGLFFDFQLNEHPLIITSINTMTKNETLTQQLSQIQQRLTKITNNSTTG